MTGRAPDEDGASGKGDTAQPAKRPGSTRWRFVAPVAFSVVAGAAYFYWWKPLSKMVTYEPVDQVNEVADWLIATDSGRELERLAHDVRARATELRIPLGRRNDAALIKMTPEKFWRFEGHRGKHADLTRWIMLDPNTVSIHKPLFANASHDIMIFAKAPASPPKGYFGRIVNDRVFVVSYHCGRCSTNPASHSRDATSQARGPQEH